MKTTNVNLIRSFVLALGSTAIFTVVACNNGSGSSDAVTATTVTPAAATLPAGATGAAAEYVGTAEGGTTLYRSGFENLLRTMGFCGQGLVNLGAANCTNLSDSAQIAILSDGMGNFALTIIGSGGQQIQTSGSLTQYNNGQGLIGRTVTDSITVTINSPTLSGSSVPADIAFEGTTFASLTLNAD